MDLSHSNLNSFLKLGYFLDYKNTDFKIDLSSVDTMKFSELNEEEILNMGTKLFFEALEKNFVTKKKHVVPISGGLDSRAILAGLLEFTNAENIYTYTFGTPGTLDYDIGRYIADKVGTNHTNYPLTDYKYEFGDLIDISNRVSQQTVLFHHPPVKDMDKKYNGMVIWSGFLNGFLTGGRITNKRSNTVNEAKEAFLLRNQYVKSTNLSNSSVEELVDLVDFEAYPNTNLDYEDILDVLNRQSKFISPHVLMKGFDYVTPYTDPEWISFMLGLSLDNRKDQYLFKKILFEINSGLFSKKTKSNFGLPLNAPKVFTIFKRIQNKVYQKLGSNPYINYLDFDEAIRNRQDINQIVKDSVGDLKSRKIIEIDPVSLFNKHMNRKAEHSDALLILTSLEIHLKAKGI
ncbi:hypothetical protein FLK61_38980 [Paenalkalicoccus suaedae]|uniref:asparagine synthase (glutamine-hydrolyzing) n=1 Tax=Paenalkalicoccus suaedae TaxID=2592382 RepID=A0A859FIR5_9BACI|nr:asparagine synthase-related protein [Paenalkalicoccus suaedae]QKS72602.1 hypothetical protein FLK61_38980 [Paenalkalicoccus suaedae]